MLVFLSLANIFSFCHFLLAQKVIKKGPTKKDLKFCTHNLRCSLLQNSKSALFVDISALVDNERKIINYEPFKTNIDYGFELAKSPYQQTFTDISRIYDYVWYGKYDITMVDYEKLENKFKSFEEKIKN